MKKFTLRIEHFWYLLLFLLPLQTRWIWKPAFLNGGYWEYGSFSYYFVEILIWIILLSYGLKEFFHPQAVEGKPKCIKMMLVLSVFGLVTLTVLSALWSFSIMTTLIFSFRLLESVGLFYFILNANFDYTKAAWAIVASAAVQSALAWWQFFTQNVFALPLASMSAQNPTAFIGESVVESGAGRFLRAYGILPHPNILGGFLALSALFALFLFLRSKKATSNLLSLFCLILIIQGIFLTFSRAALLAFIISSTVFVLLSYGFGKQFTMTNFAVLVFLVTTALFSFIFMEVGRNRVVPQGRLEQESLQDREALTRESFWIIKNYPLLGVGAGNFTYAVWEKVNPIKQYWEYQPVHSLYLLVASELGFLGLAFFSVFFICAGVLSFLRKNILGVSALLGLCILGFFDHYLWSLFFGTMFFWVMGAMSLKEVK